MDRTSLFPKLHQLWPWESLHPLFPEEEHQIWMIQLSLSTKKKKKKNPPMYVYVPWKTCRQDSLQYGFYFLSLFLTDHQSRSAPNHAPYFFAFRKGGVCLCSIVSHAFVLNSQLLLNVPLDMMSSDALLDSAVLGSGAVYWLITGGCWAQPTAPVL